MKRHDKYFYKIINDLKALKDKFPNQELSNHISVALQDYKDIWGISDKEFSFALDKYTATLETEQTDIDESYVDRIVREGMNLETLFDDEDDLDY